MAVQKVEAGSPDQGPGFQFLKPLCRVIEPIGVPRRIEGNLVKRSTVFSIGLETKPDQREE